MKVRLLSDLHFEFYGRDNTYEFIDSLQLDDTPYCVLAGDIGTIETFEWTHRLFDTWPDTKFFWVPGNHEYFGSSFDATDRALDVLEAQHENLRVFVRGDAGRFVCATLWYAPPPSANFFEWSDAQWIGGRLNIFYRAGLDAAFLRSRVQPDSLVVTHMLPHEHCVHPDWVGSPSNQFFVHDMSDLIMHRAPHVWMFGHTHKHIDVMIYNTRCVANPRGYPHETTGFDPLFEIETDT